jgi:hypothetical protein
LSVNSRPKSAIVKSRLQTRKLKNPAYLTISIHFCYNVPDSQEDKRTAMSINTSILEFAEQTAVASGMTYEIIKGSDATAHRTQCLFTPAPQSHQPRILPNRGCHA